MKAVRRIVENDLGLPKKQLDEKKNVVTALVDQVCAAAAVVGSCTCVVLAGMEATVLHRADDDQLKHTSQCMLASDQFQRP
jgi:hypothetical protein